MMRLTASHCGGTKSWQVCRFKWPPSDRSDVAVAGPDVTPHWTEGRSALPPLLRGQYWRWHEENNRHIACGVGLLVLVLSLNPNRTPDRTIPVGAWTVDCKPHCVDSLSALTLSLCVKRPGS